MILTPNALEVLKPRYLLKNEKGEIIETPEEMVKRVVDVVVNVEHTYGCYDDSAINEFKEEMYNIIDSLEFLPNSPTLMSAGKPLNQLAACFVIPIDDNMDSIMTAVKENALISKSGGGVGQSFSRLRPEGDLVKSSMGTSSGPVSFMHMFNAITDVVKQAGTRRGANMGCLRVDHPDIETFIKAKDDLTKLTNFNLSVGITDEFMEAVNAGKTEFNLINPRTKKVWKTINPIELFNLICDRAWKTGEPGLLFLDTINKNNTFPGVIETSNPCLTGDTLIFTGDGRYIVTLEQLYKEFSSNPETFHVPVLTWDNKLQRNKFQKINYVVDSGVKEVFEIVLDDNSSIEATANHKLLLSDGNKIEVKDLKIGNCLMPFAASNSGQDLNVNLNNGKSDNYYHLQAEYYFGANLDSFGTHKDNFVIHHKDENHANNLHYNLELINASDHRSLHISGDNNPMIKWYGNADEEVKLSYRVKMSKAVSGEKNGMFGKQHSDHTKFLIGEQTKQYMQDSSVIKKHKDGNNRHRASLIKATLELLQLNNLEFNEENYNNYRKKVAKTCPIYSNIINTSVLFGYENIDKFFEFLLTEFNYKVVAIKSIGLKQVYDMNVDNNHNFAIATKAILNDVNYTNLTSIKKISGIISSNCGEQPLLPYEACNLGSINLMKCIKYTDGKPSFDFGKFRYLVIRAVRFLDDVIDAGTYPLPQIDEMVKKYRKIGLGIMGWGDLLYTLMIPYDSDKAVELISKIGQNLKEHANNASYNLALKRGVYPGYDKDSYLEHFNRNACITTIAPTGTLSIFAGCSSGIEPNFAIAYSRTSMDKEYKYINPVFEKFCKDKNLNINKIIDYINKNGSLKDCEFLTEYERDVFKVSQDISPIWHVTAQAKFQEHVDNAISKTINLPKDCDVEVVKEVYKLAFETNCKGITVYRDGCRANQVLFTPNTTKNEKPIINEQTEYTRPEVIAGKTTMKQVACAKLYITVNEDEDGNIIEVFINNGKAKGCNANTEAIARLICSSLQAGQPVDKVIKALKGIVCQACLNNKDTLSNLSCADAIAKTLLEYKSTKLVSNEIKEEPKIVEVKQDGPVCPECGCKLDMAEGCMKCIICGFSVCN